MKVITGEDTEKDAGDEAGDEGANRVLNRTEDDVSMHTRLMAGGLRVVRQRKMDKDKVAAAIDRCRQPTDEEDDGPKEVGYNCCTRQCLFVLQGHQTTVYWKLQTSG